jgi:ABC-2 type transport system ATP-binding protein
MVTGLARPDAGEISLFGIDALAEPIAAKQITAWLPDEPLLYDKLTPAEYLAFIAGLWRVPPADAQPRAAALLQQLGLWDKRDIRCEGFSRGMKQKVAIACGLLHSPSVIFFDEPLTGLDPLAIRRMKDTIRRLAADGAAIVLSSHLLPLLEEVCTHVLMVKEGRKVAHGTLDEVRSLFAGSGQGGTLEEVFLRIAEESPASGSNPAAPPPLPPT